MKIEIDITPWPSADDPNPRGFQGALHIDGVDYAGWTGPGDEKDLFVQGVDILLETWNEWIR